MNLQVPTKEIATLRPPAAGRSVVTKFVTVFALITMVAGIGGGGWYYFFGRKPKLAMSVALKAGGDVAARGLWSVGPDELLLVADGDVQMIDLAARKKRWSTTIPKLAPVDTTWQAAMNARFTKLQQWSDELSRKRTNLTGEAAIKDFNTEAAKYHAALAAARTEMADPKATKPQPAATKSPAATTQAAAAAPAVAEKAKPEYVFGGDRSAVDARQPVVDAGVRIIRERMKSRTAKLQSWRTALDAKKANAKTPLQKNAGADEEARYAAELVEQRKDEEFLKNPGEQLPAPNVAGGASVTFASNDTAGIPDNGAVIKVGTADANDNGSADIADENPSLAKPMAAICTDRIWIAEGSHAVAFERSSGTVKADVRLAGPALQIFSDGAAVTVIASAGSDAVQIVRLGADAQPQSSYFSTGRHEPAFALRDGCVEPNVQKLRTEFSAIGGSLLRVEIRLQEKSVTTRAAIKPGSEKELEAAAGGAAAHSAGELKSLAALIRNDATRQAGGVIEHVDDSSYEVTLRRPFEPDVAEWSGALRGRVQVFTTPTLHLITAGTKLLAFDRANKKLWEATLGSPLPIHRSGGEADGVAQRWLEAGGRLFFADGAFLSALDVKTGQVAWRLPSVGIRKIQMDGEGNLYVLSENLSVETLTYANDASMRDSLPIVMRVQPADGKILWKAEKYRDLWASGKDVYALREAKNPADLETQVFDARRAVEARVKIYKLSRGDGSPLWDWFQPRHPISAEAQGKNVALLFADELQIIRSICW